MYAAFLLAAFCAAQPPPDANLLSRPDAFQTLVNPNCSHCIDEAKRRSGELRVDDPVLCWTRGKYDGGAIPIRFFLASYRVISDTYGTFVYDPDAGYARAFPASLKYRFHGWRNGIMVMRHEDGTLFSCLSGRAFDGPRKGEKLSYWPTIVADWGWYVKHYPGGVAYHMYEKYKPLESPSKPTGDSVRTRGKADPRLPADELVLGVWDGKKATAFPLKDFGNATAGEVGDDNRVVLWYAATRTAAAYRLLAEKRKPTTQLGFEGELIESRPVKLKLDSAAAAGPWVDEKIGLRFDITGRCVEGELKGWTLQPLESVMCKWFAWAAEYPETTIQGK
jgi:hypothetical protein